jgi:hypothetical protein
MAFLAPPPAAGSNDDRMPILAFNAKAGRLSFLDREQQADGQWTTVKQDVTMREPAFAVDFGRLETGWIYFSALGPQFAMAFYGQPMPACPDSPGITSTGKALRFKAGFRLPVIGRAVGGVRSFRANAGTIISAMNELHTAYEASAEARAGKIPLVRMTDVLEIRAGQSSNFQPVFTIDAWVDRPAALGPRTVAAPGGQPAIRPAPPPAAAAHRMPAPATRYDEPPDDDRWGDEPPARPPAGAVAARMASYLDAEVPF